MELTVKRSDETKRRLLEAATAEFAAYGIAGARVDRIAANSGCNKQAIYAYYESKEGLYEAVYNAMVVETITSVPIDAADLPGYAARLFDHYRTHPEVLRLAFWFQLERPAMAPPQAAIDASRDKIVAIRSAQEAGRVSRRLAAEHLLPLILRMSTVGVSDVSADSSEAAADDLRRALAEAVARIVLP